MKAPTTMRGRTKLLIAITIACFVVGLILGIVLG